MAAASDSRASSSPPWPVVMIAGFLVPGLGQILRGERVRGLIIGVTILALFLAGLLIGGVRIIEFPTFNPAAGNLFSKYIGGILGQVSFIAQFFMGPATFIAGMMGRSVAADPQTATLMAHGRLADIAIIYTGVAGALNLLAIIDATARAADHQPPRDRPSSPHTSVPTSAQTAAPTSAQGSGGPA